ncbi:MAG: VCBS repeat-containing protein, partial [Candidatus Electryoneaceae bacterium]|nr:VCBS repeat-containing protein [Candidatus Electryoneaceae bacterium]
MIEPIEVDVENDNAWITVEFDEILTFDVPRHFHIGYVKQGDNPRLYVDGGNPIGNRSSLRIGGAWYVTGEGSGNFLLRATVEYYDELSEDDFLFHNISEDAGIGGMSKMAWGDYDNDGWEDLLVNGRILYRNLSDGTFENVSEDAGIVQDNQAHGGTWGDFNNDGWLDFLAFNSSHNDLDRLYENSGDGTFIIANRHYFFEHGDNPTAGCGWGDGNNDGYLELYIANSEDWNDGNPVYYRDYFYAYDTDFDMLLDITPSDIARNRYYGRGVAWCDFDFDGDMDLYISNYRLRPNYLLVNVGVDRNGMPDFENQAAERGVIGV